MAEVTYFVALPFVATDEYPYAGGRLALISMLEITV